MANHIARPLTIAMLALTAAGCGTTAPSRFYTLEPVATAASGPAVPGAIMVGPVAIPATVDRPQIVTGAGPNQVDLESFNRWAEPLNDGIARVVTGNLAVLLGTPVVATAPLANFDPAYRVTIRVERFESVPGKSVLIDAVWVVRREPDGPTRQGHTLARESADGPGFDALAAAHSRALATLSGDIATGIRASGAATR